MTLTEFAEEYKLQEEKASQLDMSSLSESDKKLLASYNENTEFLKKMEFLVRQVKFNKSKQ